MRLPAFLLGATILFWGWQTGFWLVAIPLAVVYEGSRYLNWRWQLTTADFRTCSHICTVLLVGILIYLLISDRSLQLIFRFFQWLPVICAPLLVAQAYSNSDRVDLHALLFFKEKANRQQLFPLDLTYPYFAICLLAASAANIRALSFYIGAVILINFALNSIRSPRYSYFVFLLLLLLATALGTAGHIGLHRLQMSMEQNTARFFYKFYRPQTNPDKISTAIGDIGSVKQSNKIILRLKSAPQQIAPQLLTRATYNRYTSGFWGAAQANFQPVKPGQLQDTWQLDRYGNSSSSAIVSESLEDGRGLLKLPQGSWQVARLPVEKIEQNQYGTVQVFSDRSLLSYQIQYDRDLSFNSPPTDKDLEIAATEKPALDKVVTELNLAKKSPQEILTRVSQFFNTEFGYSLELARQGDRKTPLSAFLLDHRSGHCEYFATATALLLRDVGIPTRYTVGYAVHEQSSLEQQYIVRDRHAHAWTQVYIDGTWQTFDTTPNSWIAIEDNAASNWQYLQDLASLFRFKFAQIAIAMQNLGKLPYLWLLALPLGLILIRQFTRQGKVRKIALEKINRSSSSIATIGADSEIYLIEQKLNQLGIRRDRAETWQTWRDRLTNNPETSALSNNLDRIIQLHYRYCFDPEGISNAERKELRDACQTWLNQSRSSEQ